MKASIREIVGIVLVCLVVFLGLQFVLQSFRVQGTSMEPSFHDSEYLLVDKLSYRFGSPGRGDVVIFHNPDFPSELFIKRVVGLPGEKVEIKGGSFYINGMELEETPDFAPVPNSEGYSVTVPPDQYFVMGDNRSNTAGSHTFGPVPQDYIVGKVWVCYWPPSDWGLSPDYSISLQQVILTSLGAI